MTVPTAPQRRGHVPMPPGIELASDGDATLIEHTWRKPIAYVLLVAALVWNGFVVFWVTMSQRVDAPWFFALFPVLHAAAGILLLYSACAMLLNKTQIYLDRDVLRIRHGPVPWSGNCEIAVPSIEQIYCKAIVHRGKRGRTHTTYEVHLASKDGAARKLIGTNLSFDEAVFLEQAIEKALGIQDREIPGSAV